jgi:hypothetical protein
MSKGSALIIAVSLILAAMINGGVYRMVRVADMTVVIRINRLTGSVVLLSPKGEIPYPADRLKSDLKAE